MAIFSVSDLGGPQGSPFRPQQPVVDETDSQLIGLAGNMLEFAEERNAGKQRAQAVSTLDRFTQENLRLAEAHEQGRISKSEARTRARAMFSETLANNPGIFDDLQKRQEDIMTSYGLGSTLEKGTVEDQAMEDLRRSAFEEGRINPNWPEHRQEAALANYMDLVRTRQGIEDDKKKLALEQAEVTLDKSQIELRQTQRKERARKFVYELASSTAPVFRNEVELAVEQFRSGDLTAQEATDVIKQQWSKIQGTIRQGGSEAAVSHLENMSFGMKSMMDWGMDAIRGDTSMQSLRNQNERMLALYSKDMLQDPEIARIAAASRLLPNSDIVQIAGMRADVSRWFDVAKDPTVNRNSANPFQDDAEAGFGVLMDNMKRAAFEGADEETDSQITNTMTKVFNGIDVHKSYADNPSEWNSLLRFLSAPETGGWIERKGGVPESVMGKAREAFKVEYSDQVIPTITREFKNRQISVVEQRPSPGGVAEFPTGRHIPASEGVVAEFTGGGITFRSAGGRDSGTQAAVRDLNRSLGKLMNRVIRVSAHLEGHTDYRKAYEEVFADLFAGEDSGEGEDE